MPRENPVGAVRRFVAARPRFDREHCDKCLRLLSRGSLRNVQVDPKAGIAGWQVLCRECVRGAA